jgi:cell division protease FtsH
VFHEPTTGASSDIDQATKIAKAMVTEYGMSARLGAVKYGQEHGDPFLGRSMGHAVDYSLEVAHEIDEEVRALIEAAHTEAWEVLNTYRDVLDELVVELLDKETLQRKDLERIFSRVEKRPRITAFNDFGDRVPSDKPPIKTRGELAIERGEPWPPVQEEPEPTPVGAVGGAKDLPKEANNGALPNGLPSSGPYVPHEQGRPGGPPNYGAPPGWRPATSPQPDPDERDGKN